MTDEKWNMRTFSCYLLAAVLLALTSCQPTGQDETTPAVPTFPESRWVTPGEVVAEGESDSLYAWVAVNDRKDGMLSKTIESGIPLLELAIMVRNLGASTVDIDASSVELVLRNGLRLRSFPGEDWGNGFVSHDPQIIEVDGEDVSKHSTAQVEANPGSSIVLFASFVMESKESESEAVSRCDRIELPVAGQKLVLNFKK